MISTLEMTSSSTHLNVSFTSCFKCLDEVAISKSFVLTNAQIIGSILSVSRLRNIQCWLLEYKVYRAWVAPFAAGVYFGFDHRTVLLSQFRTTEDIHSVHLNVTSD